MRVKPTPLRLPPLAAFFAIRYTLSHLLRWERGRHQKRQVASQPEPHFMRYLPPHCARTVVFMTVLTLFEYYTVNNYHFFVIFILNRRIKIKMFTKK